MEAMALGGEAVMDDTAVLAVADVRDDFSDVYRRMYAGMVRLAKVIVDTEEDAVEVVQEAFAKVYPKYKRIDPGKVEAYIRSAVINGGRSHLRRRITARRYSRMREEVSVDAQNDHMLDAVRRLRPSYRDVVLLRYYADLSMEEIANTVGSKVGTVKARLHRALRELQEVLDEPVE